MKKKSFIAVILAVVLVLSMSMLAACTTNVQVTEIKVVDGSLKTEYTVGDAVDLSNAKLKVTYSDKSTKEIALTADMLDKSIDTTKAGSTTYTITYKEVKTTVTINVAEGEPEKEYTIQTFQLPEFITSYLEVSQKPDTSDANFKVTGQTYEVGNANAFLLQPTANCLDSNFDEVVLDSGLKTLYKVEVSDSADGTYTELTGDDLAAFVTVEDGYKYNFTEAAADKFVKLTVSLDSEEYIIDESVIASRTVSFKVVANGYNVYNQDGLSVMNDITRPEFWADIWGCTVDENGALQAGKTPLILEADSKPLYQYVGNVDWAILHGSITIDPDKLPEMYFWDNTRAGYCADNYGTAMAALQAKAPAEVQQIPLNGTLIDGNGNGGLYSIVKNTADDNFNKGLYNTAKVSLSGNYNAITLSKERSEGGKLLKVLVCKNTATNEEYYQMTQWFLFKMFEPKPDTGYYNDPVTEFELKNVALQGNGGRTEAVGPQGISMMNCFAKKTTVSNVVANGFYTNLGMDNYNTGSGVSQLMALEDSKLYDTYNAMAITWRGNITITNSMLKDAGGPLFVVMDGNSRTVDPNGNDMAVPTVTVDENTTMESMAMGNESWYTQLGTVVPMMFSQLRVLDQGLSQISGKTFFTEKSGAQNTYASVLTIMIPESGTALGDKDFNNYKFTGIMTSPTDTSSMLDVKFRTVTDMLATMNQGTVVIKSGNCYAYVWKDTNGNQVLLSYDMMMKQLQAAATGGNPLVDVTSADYLQGLQAMAMDWRANSTDTITIWLQAQTGNSTSPYLGIVIGNYHAVEAK